MTRDAMDPRTQSAGDLELVAEHTERLLRTARSLDDPGAASLCEGWTRGHVATHVARNAEAIGRLCDWAVSGTPQEMYPGGAEARDRAIDEGAGRPVDELAADLAATASDLEPRLRALGGALGGALAVEQVEMRGGFKVPSRQLPFLRLRELVYHHVDLDAGFAFGDVDGELLRRFVDDAVSRLGLGHHPPDLRLTSDEGDTWTVGQGTTTVTGPRSGLLLWLARRVPEGVRAPDGDLPTLPRGA